MRPLMFPLTEAMREQCQLSHAIIAPFLPFWHLHAFCHSLPFHSAFHRAACITNHHMRYPINPHPQGKMRSCSSIPPRQILTSIHLAAVYPGMRGAGSIPRQQRAHKQSGFIGNLETQIKLSACLWPAGGRQRTMGNLHERNLHTPHTEQRRDLNHPGSVKFLHISLPFYLPKNS